MPELDRSASDAGALGPDAGAGWPRRVVAGFGGHDAGMFLYHSCKTVDLVGPAAMIGWL